MVKKERNIVLACHHPDLEEALELLLEEYGKVTRVSGYDELRERAHQEEFDTYFMDLNYGTPGATDISPAREIYQIVRERVERGQTTFIGFSFSQPTQEAARQEGIPAYDTSDLTQLSTLENYLTHSRGATK
jgi:DNA-binding NarL/FixJ family response regulator